MEHVTLHLEYDHSSGYSPRREYVLRMDHLDVFREAMPPMIRSFLVDAAQFGFADSGIEVAWDGEIVDPVDGIALRCSEYRHQRRPVEDVWADILDTWECPEGADP